MSQCQAAEGDGEVRSEDEEIEEILSGIVVMTEEQKSLFVSAAISGIVCGLWHPYEWLVNYNRNLQHWCVYEEIPQREREMNEAFLALFRECDCGEGDPVKFWTVDDMYAAINNYYKAGK